MNERVRVLKGLFSRAVAVTAIVVSTTGCGGGNTPTSPTGSSSTPIPIGPVATSGPPTTSGLFNGIAATLTSHSVFGVVAASPSGERLGIATQKDSSGQIRNVTGATLAMPDGSTAVVYAGTDGLPARAVFNEVVVTFSNYTSNTVDLSVVAANGAVTTTRGVAIDARTLADLKSASAQLSAAAAGSTRPAVTPLDLRQDLQGFALGLKIGGTLLSVASCSTFIATGGSFVIGAGGCLSLVVNVAKEIFPQLDGPLLDASTLLMSAATCAGADVNSCTEVIVSALLVVTRKAETILASTPAPTTPTPPAPDSAPVITSASISPSVALVGANTTIAFQVQASDADNNTLTYLWEFPDGTTSDQRAFTRVFQHGGVYRIRVNVSNGKTSTSRELTLNMKTMIGGWIEESLGGYAGRTFTLNQSGSSIFGTYKTNLAECPVTGSIRSGGVVTLQAPPCRYFFAPQGVWYELPAYRWEFQPITDGDNFIGTMYIEGCKDCVTPNWSGAVRMRRQ